MIAGAAPASGPAAPPECPWYALAEYGPPNVKWCEERLCALVNEPANAWSNLAFVAAAVAVAALARRGAPLSSPVLRAFPALLVLLGACSFAYHATNVLVTQLLDFFGMYLLCLSLLMINAARLGLLASRWVVRASLLGSAALALLTGLLAQFGAPIQALVGALVAAIVATELRCPGRRPGRPFALALALLGAAGLCSALDVTRVWCDPQDHVLQGHALWHLLAACGLVAAFVHYRRVDHELAGP